MFSSPKELYTREEVRELDKIAIEGYAIPGITLMERAGQAAFTILQQKWSQAKQLVIFCGIGNNGGDGYILARIALEHDYNVVVYQVGDSSKIKGDALLAYTNATNKGIKPIPWQQQMIVADVIVDAIFGTGLNTPLIGEALTAVQAINNSNIPVLAIDIPTGLDANTGIVLGDAVCSVVTVTFIGNKRGMFTGKARDHCGEIIFSSLEVPQEIYNNVKHNTIKLDFDELKRELPIRKSSSHKGECGRVVVIGGAPGMGGAVHMAGEAALRVGAGLVYIVTHSEHAGEFAAMRPELICFGVETNNINKLLQQIIVKRTVILIGPGLGKLEWSKTLFNEALKYKTPMVIDADGLNLISDLNIDVDNCILTPHPGEAARLLNTEVVNIEADRFLALTSLQQKFKSTIVLKGAGTLVNYHNKIGICCAGNASMATAGMGDILAGIIAGLLAQGLDGNTAAACGVCLHAVLGDLVSKHGKYGMIATDLFSKLSRFCRRQ
jgi:NAD(P)H-hydrate epimerase